MKSKQTVLIVDDDQTTRKILKLHLESEYDVREAKSGEQALEILDEFTPTLVLLDVVMDGMDGYQVTRKIRQNQELHYTKVILITGRNEAADRIEGYHCGADDYLVKPVCNEELKVKVGTFSRMNRLEHEIMALRTSIRSFSEV